MTHETKHLEEKVQSAIGFLHRILGAFPLPAAFMDHKDETIKSLIYSMETRNDRLIIRAYSPVKDAQNAMQVKPQIAMGRYDLFWFAGHGSTSMLLTNYTAFWLGDPSKDWNEPWFVVNGSELACYEFSKYVVEKHFPEPPTLERVAERMRQLHAGRAGRSLDGGIAAGVIADQITGRTEVKQSYYAVGGGGGGSGGKIPDGATVVVPGMPSIINGVIAAGGGGGGNGGFKRDELITLTSWDPPRITELSMVEEVERMLENPQALQKEAAVEDPTIEALLKHREEAQGDEKRLALIGNLIGMACYAYLINKVKQRMSKLTSTIGDTMFDKAPAGLTPTGIPEDDDIVDRMIASMPTPEIGIIDLLSEVSITPLTDDDYAPGDSPEDPEPQGS